MIERDQAIEQAECGAEKADIGQLPGHAVVIRAIRKADPRAVSADIRRLAERSA
jgi:hypothetical protein